MTALSEEARQRLVAGMQWRVVEDNGQFTIHVRHPDKPGIEVSVTPDDPKETAKSTLLLAVGKMLTVLTA